MRSFRREVPKKRRCQVHVEAERESVVSSTPPRGRVSRPKWSLKVYMTGGHGLATFRFASPS